MPQIVLYCLLGVSILTFLLYGIDKSKARRGAWRIPEKTLLLFSFCGGAAGGMCGMYLFRHKTRHWYFVAVNLLGLVWQVALLVWLFAQ